MSSSAGSDRHRERIRQAFTDQAAAFEDRRFNQAFSTDSEWLFDRLPRSTDDLVLDVAAGTGHAARQLAPAVRAVVALDATPAMLVQGRTAAAEEGIGNVVFALGDAAALPFIDAGFDIVVCRYALHHFERPEVQIAEMRRCLRAAGRLAVADIVADPDPDIAGTQNELERLRDPSHTRMLTSHELTELLGSSGLEVASLESRWLERPLAPWLEYARAAPSVGTEIRALLLDELDGGAVTGFAPRVIDGELCFRQTFASVVATLGQAGGSASR
jgi:ubiquinone/menaquinone biosynthesis C-methylase UbiE